MNIFNKFKQIVGMRGGFIPKILTSTQTRKTRKTRKSRKSRKSRKTRKSRKH